MRRDDAYDTSTGDADPYDTSEAPRPPLRPRLASGVARPPMSLRIAPSGRDQVRRYAAIEDGGNESAWVCRVIAEAVARREDRC